MKINEIISKNDKDTKSLQDQGLYVSVDFDSKTKDRLEKFMEEHRIPNRISRDKLHSTVVYSRKWIPFRPKAVDIQVNPRTYEWKMFGDEEEVLVLAFRSPELHNRWKQARNLGATWDYDDYSPHVTLSYDAKGFDFSSLPLPKFPLRIIKEEHTINDPGSIKDED